MEKYQNRNNYIYAKQLDTDAVAHVNKNHDIYLNGGTYLIENELTGQLYPISKELFKYLFVKKEETNE